jgi:Tfp pilus assembly PilM family ATPase
MATFKNILQWVRPSFASLGLEITDSYIKLAEIRTANGKKPVLTEGALEPLPEGTVVDGKILKPEVLQRILEQTLHLYKFRARKVHLIIPSSSIMVRFLKLPNVPDKQLRKIIQFEIQNTIHLPFQNPYFDFINLTTDISVPVAVNQDKEVSYPDPVHPQQSWMEMGASQESLLRDEPMLEDEEEELELDEADVMLIAAPAELVDEYLDVIRQSGLRPKSIEIKALSSYRLLEAAEPELLEQTILALDLNADAADMSIFHEGQLKITRSVPVRFQEENDSLNGMQQQEPHVELAHELERLMNFYRYTLNNRTQEFAAVVLTGEIRQLDQVSGFLTERLGMQVITPDSGWLESEKPQLRSWVTSLAVPIGLGLRGNQG